MPTVSPEQSPTPVPRYGTRSLADLSPSLLQALGVADLRNPLGLERTPRACLMLIDGLGWQLLHAHREAAPFLTEAAGPDPIDAPFPTTTVASLGCIATGRAPGEHGLIGATVALPDRDRAMNLLKWRLHGLGPSVELTTIVVPEEFQPATTVFELAAEAGLQPLAVGPPEHEHTGLSRAVLRGVDYLPAASIEEVVDFSVAAFDEGHRFVYSYHGRLDGLGHVKGSSSPDWEEELAIVDRAVAEMAERLPPDTLLLVVGDHGMVDVSDEDHIDVAEHPELQDGVRVIAGEPRLRHVHAQPGAADDLLAAWREHLGERASVMAGEDAVQRGWFGPRVRDEVRRRVGDVVAAALDPVAILQKDVDPRQAELVGHHGSVTEEERHVPLVVIRAS